ncbi:hypothetical protein [Porphyromonas sp.]|uniref:hypothetical protein n=1 Tax=Porphyromonas sp. TaxID=1924944 RepID=UPI0026DBD476|nr:hypothetical protein [Porphyromonas sp.]MDO4771180.1 hypothetical protein [Porphyromonas sp.]
MDSDNNLPITAETRLLDLLSRHPWLRAELPKVNPAFSMLSTPFAKIMIPKVTVGKMSERSGMPLDKLIESLTSLIAEHDRE